MISGGYHVLYGARNSLDKSEYICSKAEQYSHDILKNKTILSLY